MKDRIRAIMEKENLTPARFADRLQINRAVISHILNGRNNPSLDVVTRILDEMQYINPEWLLKGTGGMLKNGFERNDLHVEPDLFRQTPINQREEPADVEERQETLLKPTTFTTQNIGYKQVEPQKIENRKISQIIIYYTDNTFEIFKPGISETIK
ncbi:MAG: helix-turn-helix transcriptional regulator [Mariniphaga sp.]|nr:helix-turn-helix transcriptional regulator [Mariniphaga sp.]